MDSAYNWECILEVDLGAVRSNYRLLQSKCPTAICAATVKANAYGLGATRVAPALYSEGCRNFCVANLKEALDIRKCFPDGAIDGNDQSKKIRIFVIYGYYEANEKIFEENPFISPILSTLSQILAWHQFCSTKKYHDYHCVIHIDTGMARLGLTTKEVELLIGEHANIIKDLNISYVASHLSIAEEQMNNEMNLKQLNKFKDFLKYFPGVKGSLSNSGGVFLGPDFQLDLCRPGIALYSGNPLDKCANPMRNTIKLSAPIIHLQELDEGTPVGYCMKYTCPQPATLIATFPLGYADGYSRKFSQGNGKVFINGVFAPVVGNVSMDLITVDVTHVLPRPKLGDFAEIYGDNCTIDDMASLAGTISYEILTSLGKRYTRIYKNSENNDVNNNGI